MSIHQDDDTPPPPSWHQRPRPVGFEMSYRLDGTTLEIDSTRRVDRVDLAGVEQVRFFFAPSNISSKAFRTTLRLRGGKTVTFGNLSWRSLTDINRDDARYHRFVAALTQAITKANPQARFVAGKPFLLWAALAIVSGLSLLMLTVFAARSFHQGLYSAGWLGLALMAAAAWQVWPMVKLNRPRPLAAGEVPDDLVPGRPGA